MQESNQRQGKWDRPHILPIEDGTTQARNFWNPLPCPFQSSLSPTMSWMELGDTVVVVGLSQISQFNLRVLILSVLQRYETLRTGLYYHGWKGGHHLWRAGIWRSG